MFYMFLILYTMVNLILMFISSPMMMMMMMILQIINMSIIIGLINKSFWYSYILFLIIIGGLMVLFIYMTSLISNNIYKFNMKKMIFISMILMLMILILIIKYNPNINNIIPIQFMNNLNNNTLMKIYNNYSMMMIFLMMNYLFFALLVSTKIINLFYGPLRSK
uniref:NADH dehydrogenase subunit 6 n=1 Tax=Ceraclea indistincta TaxID=2904887 RepID=A0A9E8LNR0_9NEOP|nr:NADH dehydrogenase subunit 6 [Ceraclea indistincta]UZZ43828.1 NADH dehydrogenase subunit 6 [Ceraclea indistincta]